MLLVLSGLLTGFGGGCRSARQQLTPELDPPVVARPKTEGRVSLKPLPSEAARRLVAGEAEPADQPVANVVAEDQTHDLQQGSRSARRPAAIKQIAGEALGKSRENPSNEPADIGVDTAAFQQEEAASALEGNASIDVQPTADEESTRAGNQSGIGSESDSNATIDVPQSPTGPDEKPKLSNEYMTGPYEAAPAQNELTLNEVIESIYRSYPMLRIALQSRLIASGEQLAAQGAFDLKLKANADNGPLGFYRTYRNGIGLEQSTYWGGEVFGGYRLGDGNFQPWYGNRETNQGGEFKAGVTVPLAQNRAIDERRAELWKATYGQNAVEPFIQAQIIDFVRAGSLAYWEWVAAGLNDRFATELLELANKRQEGFREEVDAGRRPGADLVDNERLIVSRKVKKIDADRKLQSAAIKLSLFLRTADGQPIVPAQSELPVGFPMALPFTLENLNDDIQTALSQRPELVELDFQRRIQEIELAQAHNLSQPALDATIMGSQDVGRQTSKGDKTPFELEALVSFSMPLQRRKAMGKVWAVEGKIAQITAKRQFAQDKISTEVQVASVALANAFKALSAARESVKLNEQMEAFEVFRLEGGGGDLLRVNLREQATFDARVVELDALADYYQALALYRAALATDIPAGFEMPGQ